MSSRLALIRDDIRVAVGQYFTVSTIDDRIIDQAIDEALPTFLDLLPAIETTITTTAAGYEYDLTTYIADLYHLATVAYPYTDGVKQPIYGYRVHGIATVVFDTYVSLGAKIRVEYKVAYTAATLPDRYRDSFVRWATAQLLDYERAALTINGADATKTAPYHQLAESFRKDVREHLQVQRRTPYVVTWGNIGL